MTKIQKSTSKIPRIYLVFFDENHDEIPLSFRSEESLEKYIIEHKISKSNILYITNEIPKTHQYYPLQSIKNTIGAFSSNSTTKRFKEMCV